MFLHVLNIPKVSRNDLEEIVVSVSEDPEAKRTRGEIGWIPQGILPNFDPLFFGVDENPFKNEWEVHSESITILDVDDVIEIVNKKDGILIDSYTKDVKPEKTQTKKESENKKTTPKKES